MTESLTTFTGRFLDRALRIAPPAAMFIFFLAGSVVAAPSDKTLVVRDALRYPHVHSEKSDPTVSQRCFCPQLPEAGTSPLNLPRQSPWSLPQRTLAGGQKAALNVLVLRVDFQLESPDNPLTTGVGKMDFRSLQEFTAQYGHEIDPTPHDSAFYNQHMLSLADYYDFVSRGTLQLTWDIWPRGDALRSGDTLTYLLPRQMAYYGDTLLVEARLTEFFRDCVRVADSINPEIRFGDYQSIIIFHAGADRQNDVGFPATPFDLLTGFIRTEDTIWVDNDSTAITNGLFAPEQASQDNRATALNAVLAHEFGHQLGLVDLYSTRTGFTQIGDFALMDNNGFGVGIDFGFSGVFQTFGAFPVYMSAFSRAFLGFDSVVVLPRGTPLFLAAAELDTAANAPRIAKVPISDFEYFLLENRQQVIDTTPGAPFVVADPATGVIIGPARDLLNRIPSGEFDFLLPGNGILIYHVDESVAFGDADGDGVLNWRDNDLQWDPNRRFITLVEADGFIDLGGNFFKGFGGASDYWTPTGFNSLTPNTNPSTRSTTGAVTHIGIQIIDSTRFNHNISVSTQNSLLRSNYPIWGGSPRVDLNVIAAEIDSTPGEELIFASGSDLIVSAQDGSPGWQFASQLVKSLIRYADTVDFFIGYDSSVAPMTRVFPKNLFARLPGDIQSGPVFGTLDGQQIVAVAALDTVYAFGLLDSNPFDPRPDSVWKFATGAPALEVMFNGALFALTSSSVIRFDILNDPGTFSVIPGAALNWAAVGAGSVVVHSASGNADQMSFVGRPGVTTRSLTGAFDFGPWATDFDRDGQPEVGLVSSAGDIVILTVDTSTATPLFLPFANAQTGREISSSPALGDFDNDGYADMIFGGAGNVIGLNQKLAALDNFPLVIDRAFTDATAFGEPLIADVDSDGAQEIIVGADVAGAMAGNIYALGEGRTFGFPLPAGGALRGAPVIARHVGGASLGYLGVDGFFYLWQVDDDPSQTAWRMGGGDPTGRAYFDSDALGSPKPLAGGIVHKSFFCYPNPATGTTATVHYELGDNASSVSFTMFDLSGRIMREFSGGGSGGFANEVSIDCNGLTPGVYRLRLEVVFANGKESAFTDLAVVH